MPGSWPDGERDPADDRDLEPDERAAGQPVHPDDRLWRHPSELAWLAPPAPPPDRGGRVWTLALTSGLTGAALALGVVALVSTLGTTRDAELDERFALTGTVATTPTGLASVAEAVLPSVVRIEVVGGTAAAGGTGVVVLDDGHVLTSAHVLDGGGDLQLVVADGTTVPARVVGIDPLTDLAVVAPAPGHADDVDWAPATLADGEGVGVGEAVVAVGAPFGVHGGPSISVGVVSAIGSRMGTARGSWLHGMIETDAPVAAGAAGGALCDRTGAVVGLSSTPSGEGGAGYATPIDLAWRVAEALIADGEVHHVWLGIEGADVAASAVGSAVAVNPAGGVAVRRVVPGSPAEAAGLQVDDELVAIDGTPVRSMDALVARLRRYAPDDEVTLTVRRAGDTEELVVVLGERVG